MTCEPLKYTMGKVGDRCIQSFHLGRYIVEHMVGNLVLRRRARGAVNVIDKLGVFHANQISMCLDPHLN